MGGKDIDERPDDQDDMAKRLFPFAPKAPKSPAEKPLPVPTPSEPEKEPVHAGDGISRHCWTGKKEHMYPFLEVGSEEWLALVQGPDATCLLPAGHDGSHKWTPDSEITVRFL